MAKLILSKPPRFCSAPAEFVIRSTVHQGRVIHHAGNVAFLSRAAAVAFVGAPPPNQYRQDIWDSFSPGAHPYHVDD